jgi:hypothetical protein
MLPDSKVVGCMIRGLNPEVLDQHPKGFKYINCLGAYKTTPKNITSVEFEISRYGQFTHTLEFTSPISEKEAIEKVEEYLSQALTEDYYNMIVNDLFHEYQWEEAREYFSCRGDCLTDCKFLERTYIDNGRMTFFIGS